MIAFSQSEDRSAGVQATLRKADGSLEEVEAAYLIDAEGAHSAVRHSMDLPFEGDSLPHSYALADLYLDGDLPEEQLSLFVPQSGLLSDLSAIRENDPSLCRESNREACRDPNLLWPEPSS